MNCTTSTRPIRHLRALLDATCDPKADPQHENATNQQIQLCAPVYIFLQRASCGKATSVFARWRRRAVTWTWCASRDVMGQRCGVKVAVYLMGCCPSTDTFHIVNMNVSLLFVRFVYFRCVCVCMCVISIHLHGIWKLKLLYIDVYLLLSFSSILLNFGCVCRIHIPSSWIYSLMQLL